MEGTKDIAKEAARVMESYLESDKSFQLDPSFSVYITMISIDHTRQRRSKNLKVTKVGSLEYDIDEKLMFRWAYDFPAQVIANSENWDFLSKNCLLVSTALGLAQIYQPKEFKRACRILVSKTNTRPNRSEALNFIRKEIEEILAKCPEVGKGPHHLEDTLKILTSKLGFQASVFTTKQPNILFFKFPPEIDFTLPQIWYYLENEKHVKLIHRRKTFGNKFGRGFCPGCNEVIKTHNYIHRCPNLDTCFACHRPFQAEDYFIDPLKETLFCDGKMDNSSGEKTKCKGCNYICCTPLCKKLHQQSVCSKVYYCEHCKQHFFKSSTFKTKQAMIDHKCDKRRCKICNELIGMSEGHLCKLKSPKLPSLWPRMVFVNIENCYNTEKDTLEPHYATAAMERKQPGIFHTFQFSAHNDFLTDKENCPSTYFVEEYWGEGDRPKFGYAKNTFKKRMKNLFATISKSTVARSLEERIILQILQSCHKQKTSVIVKNSTAMTYLLRGCLSLKLNPEIIAKERNLIFIQVKGFGLSFISAESYYPFKTQELNKLFGIYDEPFFFPQKLNAWSKDVLNFNGEIPESDLWEEFNDTDNEKFEKYLFIRARADAEWNYKSELLNFSMKKCQVLAKACLRFISESVALQVKMKSLNLGPKVQRREPGEMTPVDFFHPMSDDICTRASFLMTCFLAISSRPVIYCVDREYLGGVHSPMSKKEIIWLHYEMNKDSQRKHVNGLSSASGQKRFIYTIADDFVPETGKVLFFNGCYWHAHDCQAKKPDTLRKKSLELRQKQMVKNLSKIEKKFNVSTEVIWECHFDKQIKQEPMKTWFENNGPIFHPGDRLKPRDAIFGGYSEVFSFLWSLKKNPLSQVFSIDINSLYPTCGMMDLPIGMPETLLYYEIRQRVMITSKGILVKKKESDEWEPFLGLIYCTILPPRSGFLSHFPYIQKRTPNGLIAGLCAKCVDDLSDEPCNHTDKQRCWNTVQTSVDLEFCLAHGYKLLGIWEMMHYTQKTPFLADMIRLLGREKIRNEGFPNDEPSQEYCEFVNQRMGFEGSLKLNLNDVQTDSKKKKLAKQNLVSFIGKFMQSNLKNKSRIVNCYNDLFEILVNSKSKVLNLRPVSDESLIVVTKTEKEDVPPHLRSNCIIGAIILSQAKKTLFSHMYSINCAGGKLLMVDTDSITFEMQRQGGLNIDGIQFSTAFGDFKHNYGGKKIVNFFALASKNYSITTKDFVGNLHQDIKMRGMTLKNQYALASVADEYERMVESALKGAFNSVKVEQERQNVSATMTERSRERKIFLVRNNLSKNRVILDRETKPYGFVE